MKNVEGARVLVAWGKNIACCRREGRRRLTSGVVGVGMWFGGTVVTVLGDEENRKGVSSCSLHSFILGYLVFT